MSETVAGEMNVRRVTLPDGRYSIFYEFSGDLLQSDLTDDRIDEPSDNSLRHSDRGSSV
jgi:hypothetical protein